MKTYFIKFEAAHGDDFDVIDADNRHEAETILRQLYRVERIASIKEC